MSRKDEHPKPHPQVFSLSWESEEPEEAGEQAQHEAPAEDDVESHGMSGFNAPQ